MTITILHKYLYHDIKQLTTRYAEARNMDAETRDMAQIGDGQSDKELIMRLIITGVSKMKRLLKDKLVLASTDADDKLPKEKESWSFPFKDETEADGESLAGLMHWFVVRTAVYEWCAMFSPNDMAAAKLDADETKNDLDDILSASMPMKEKKERLTEDWPAEIEYTYSNE